MTRGFEQLVAEAVAVPLRGWDFGWLAGRAEGSDPSWDYPGMARELVRGSARLLDVDTGGGEMLSGLGPLPPGSLAVEPWAPNVPVAAERLGPLGVTVRFRPEGVLPVGDGEVDLVLNRHGRLLAGEVSRVLRPGGTLLTQQVGSADCAELNEALGAPPAYGSRWDAATAVAELAAVGLRAVDVREEWPLLTFHDVGAVVFQLRAVPWQVADFDVERYAGALRRIDAAGPFRVRAHRFLIKATS